MRETNLAMYFDRFTNIEKGFSNKSAVPQNWKSTNQNEKNLRF
jgi:hypothetical protein